jgi:hypothetical protein
MHRAQRKRADREQRRTHNEERRRVHPDQPEQGSVDQMEKRHVVVEDVAILDQPLGPRPDDVEVLGLVVVEPVVEDRRQPQQHRTHQATAQPSSSDIRPRRGAASPHSIFTTARSAVLDIDVRPPVGYADRTPQRVKRA